MIKIVQKDDPVLRRVAEEVPPAVITSAKIKKIVADMQEALASQKDGVAIAAPQIGESWRIFVISKEIVNMVIEKEKKDKGRQPKIENEVFINPIIIKLSREKKLMEEGCLSVRYLYGKVKRSTKATVRAFDENGKIFERGASGLLAQVFQHEVDHLNAVLFTDMAKNLEEIPPEKTNSKETRL